MASVAICPHCYLQLVVPDGTAGDARVECPTCHKEFDLPQAVLRPIPEVLPVAKPTAAAALTVEEIDAQELPDEIERDELASELPLESPVDAIEKGLSAVARADEDIAAWFRRKETVAEMPPVVDEVEIAADEIAVEEPRTQPRSMTLAELMAERTAEEAAVVPGPSFDLPHVPLVRENGGTVEFDSMSEYGVSADTEFELDDVDFESTPTHSPATDRSEPFSNEPEFASTAAADVPVFASDNFPDASVVVGAPRRRRRSPLRMLVGTVLGGLLGLGVGYYLLMYLLGPTGDFLEVAKYVPSQLLPSSFARTPAPLVHTLDNLPKQPELPTELPVPDDSANIPAGYVESAAELPASENPSPESDRYEPSEFDDAPAEPLATEPLASEPTSEPEMVEPATVAMPLPLKGPTYTVSQLEAVLTTAEQAEPGLVDGDLSDAAVRRTKGLSYAKLCDLADTLVFTKVSPEVPGEIELQARAAQLFQKSLEAAHTRDEVARIAAIWIDSPHRRHGGVFLAGTVSGGQIAGDVYEYQLDATDGSTYTVLSSQPIDAADGAESPFAIVGSIVNNPVEEVAGYTGTAPRAIWASHALPLP